VDSFQQGTIYVDDVSLHRLQQARRSPVPTPKKLNDNPHRGSEESLQELLQ
jgi:hypothetical protein